MPFAKDKILVNNGGLRSYLHIVTGWFLGIFALMKVAKKQTKELKKHGWLQEQQALEFLREQEENCAAIDAASGVYIEAMTTFHAKQMNWNNRVRIWTDKMLASQPQP